MNSQVNRTRGPLAFSPSLCGAAHLQLQKTVEGLREALCKAITEINSLKEAKGALEEKVQQLESSESQLKTELKEKDDIIIKMKKKRSHRVRAHIDCLAMLAVQEKELQTCVAECRATHENLEVSLHHEAEKEEASRESLQQENKSLKEQVSLLETEQSQMKDELHSKDELITQKKKKAEAQANAYIDCLALLMLKENEVKRGEAGLAPWSRPPLNNPADMFSRGSCPLVEGRGRRSWNRSTSVVTMNCRENHAPESLS
ncbi:DNA recombination protein RmuC homolog isoform X2 [Paralichthys olivaceus]|uniref:DNA recombination protein RmuC homolog isoform X2 n=1 Tax=Paralichthys olivaceus TaxID=8255 RepID=UPI00375151CA